MSKVIKASRIISMDDKVVIQHMKLSQSFDPEDQGSEPGDAQQAQDPAITEAQAIQNRIISDAESSAETILAQASQAAQKMKDDAKAEIQVWWKEKRAADQETAERAKQDGYQSGHQEGLIQAEEAVQEHYAGLVDSARALIEQASFIKQQMILEAEPFLIQLSTSIAEKIIGRQLSLEPDWVVDSIRKILQRKREQGVISLCVSPSQFTFIQDAREELLLAIDSQAELQVLPDPSVNDYGCVVRSSFGSIDARVDTQLEEIKDALLQLFRRSEGSLQDE